MSNAPSTKTIPGTQRVQENGHTFFMKKNGDSNTDRLYLSDIGYKGTKSKSDLVLTIQEAINLSNNPIIDDQSKNTILTSLNQYTNARASAARIFDTQAEVEQSYDDTERLVKRADSQRESEKVTSHENTGRQEDTEEQRLPDSSDSTSKDPLVNSNIADPITGKLLTPNEANDSQSFDSNIDNQFRNTRDEYLKGNTSINPAALFELSSISSIDRALGQGMRGINTLKAPTSIPSYKDSKGYIFFTRPQLNLQDYNIANHRKFYPLLNDNPTSIQRQIRGLLDPRIQRDLSVQGVAGSTSTTNVDLMRKIGYSIKGLDCPFVDKLNPFIPILTNTCESMSGFPDLALNTFSSKPGMHKESYVQYDDIAKTAETIDIECTFKGVLSDPITWLFYIWEMYGALVFEGILMPYMDYIGENWIDYQTRIWRLVMDKSNTYVTKIAATGPAVPISLPLGTFFDFDVDTPYNDQAKSISVRFRCMGVESLDDVLVDDFNRTTFMFNPNMRDNVRSKHYVKVPSIHKASFNHLAYPYINPNSYELEWWCDTSTYLSVLRTLQMSGMYGGNL